MGTNDTETALISGGSSGLGKECARLLIAEGKTVCLVARRDDRLRSAAREVGSGYRAVHSIAADVGTPEDLNRIEQYLAEQQLSVKWLMNIAGVGVFGPLGSYSPAEVHEVLRGNLLGMMFLTQRFLGQVISNEGVICNVTSTAATVGRENETVYSAAKWGARGFTESLRAEMKGKPVRVMCVYPGGMNTPFWDHSRHHADRSEFMHPEDVAAIIVSNLLQDRACQISELTISRK